MEQNNNADDKSPYQGQNLNRRANVDYTYDDLQRHLILGQEVLKESYELKRIMASQVVVYLLADLDRLWKEEQPHALPVMFFYRGYSLSMEIARKMTEKCKDSLRSHGLDVVVTAADGEFNQLMVKGRENQPLTQNQLMKDVWKDSTKLTKVQILELFVRDSKPGSPVRDRYVVSIQTEKARLHNIKTPIKGWTQLKRISNTENETEVENEESTIEQDSNQISNNVESIEPLPDIQTLADYSNEETSDQNQADEPEVRDEMTDTFKIQLDMCDIHNVLKQINNRKWSNVVQEDISRHLQSAENLKKLTVKELTELTKYVNEKQKDSSKNLKTSNVRKHELVNNLSRLIGDGSTTEARATFKKRKVEPLRQLAHRVIMKKTYPKKVLNVGYANYVWPDKVKYWKENARVSNFVEIKGLDRVLYPYYVPDRNETGDFEVFVYDKTHLGSNLRKCVCLGKVQGISKQAWHKVAHESPEILHPLVIEVSEDGKVQDQMKEKFARNMFSTGVEECMWTNGYTAEASFCRIIREGLFEAEDTPGIRAVERCNKRLDLIDWLSEGVRFGDFPPFGATIKGMSSILYEGLRTSTEAKLYLYALSNKGTYCVRAPNTLCSESFFSSMQEMDPWGQGVLTAEGIEKHISDFTTLTALKMKDDRSFYINTNRDKKYPVPKVSTMPSNYHQADDIPECKCRSNKYIRCVVPRDHFFDSQDRARGRKRSQKPVQFSGFNESLKGDKPVRSRYGYKINEAKVLTSKRVGLQFTCE